MKRLQIVFHIFMRLDYLIMNFSKNQHILCFSNNRKRSKTLFSPTHSQPQRLTGGAWVHGTTANNAVDRRKLVAGEVSSGGTCTNVILSTSRIPQGYYSNLYCIPASTPSTMAARWNSSVTDLVVGDDSGDGNQLYANHSSSRTR